MRHAQAHLLTLKRVRSAEASAAFGQILLLVGTAEATDRVGSRYLFCPLHHVDRGHCRAHEASTVEL